MSASSSKAFTPLPQILVTADDVRGDPEHFASLLNQIFTNQNQMINALLGSGGSIPINTDLDLQGNKVTNLSTDTPTSPSDAVSKAHADATYSAPVLAPQLEANGSSPLSTYRIVSNPYQQELNTSYLNTVANTAPAANSSNVTFGSPSGGFVPVTISSGLFTRADGTTIPYPQFNDSVPTPAIFNINTISRTSGLVTGNTTGVNTLQAGNTVVVAGVGNTSYNGQFVLTFVGTGGSPPGPVFQFSQAGADSSSSGGTISLYGIYYYCLKPSILQLYRVGPYAVDTVANRINAQKDGSGIIAIVSVTGAGGDPTNTAAGATSPQQNIGGGNRILNSA